MKKKILISIVILILLLFFFFGKVDISPVLLKTVTNELKDITGMEVVIDRVYLTFLPLYVEFNNVQLLTPEKDNLILKKVKLYIGLTKILNKEIEVRRAVIYNGNFSLKYSVLNNCIDNISNYLKKPAKFPLKFTFNSFEINNISGLLYNPDTELNLKNLYGRVVLKAEPDISLMSNIKLYSLDYPNLETSLKAHFIIKDNELLLEELKLFDMNSLIQSSGTLNYHNFLGEFLISGKIFFKSLMKIFGINASGYGELNIDGKIKLLKAQSLQDRIRLDLTFDGSFLLEQLMQILKVSEKLSGFTEISNGKAEGTLSNPIITANVKLKQGNIFGVKVDKINSEAIYQNGILAFKNGKANLYGGVADIYVWITLPVVSRHYVLIEMNNVSSNGIFELIQWNPGIAHGTVSGWLLSEGKEFSPEGSFVYVRTGETPVDLRGKIEWIKGNFYSVNGIYNFNGVEIALSKTRASANGYIDNNKNYLDFNFVANSKDINELLMPYQRGIYGDIDIKGKLSGNLKDPEISINFLSQKINIVVHEIEKSIPEQSITFNNLTGNIIYKKNALLLSNISGNNISIKGKVLFPQAKNLFEMNNPVYDILFSVNSIPVNNLYIKAINNNINTYLDLDGSIKDKGIVTATTVFTPIFIEQKKILDKIEAMIELKKNAVFIKKLSIYNSGNVLYASGYVDFGGIINFTGKSKNFDITAFTASYTKKLGMQYVDNIVLNNLDFDISGSLKSPEIKANTNIIMKIKNGRVVDGTIILNYKNNYLIAKSILMKNIFFTAEGSTVKNQWSINGSFNSARIDILAGAFLNNLPEDLVVLVDGKIGGEIVNNNINARIDLNRIFARLYGIGLNNKNPVNVRIKNGNIYFNPVTLIGQSTELTIKGKIVEYFDILVEGVTDLRPFKALFNVDDIRGRATIQLYIYENKNNPEIAGGVDITNASITFRKNIPSLSNINATLSFNEDRVVIEKAYGTFSEGTVQMDGTVYLDKFSIKQFALSGKLAAVRWIFAPRCWAYINGQIYLTGSYSQSLLSGQINIQKGVYTERFEWTKLALQSNASKNIVAKDSWLSNLKFNLRIQTDNFFVNNNLATINLNSDLLLRGTIVEPSLIGWINAKDGWIYFRDSRFDLLRLLIQFTDPNSIKPYLLITARTTVSQYNINLNLNGYIDQFNLILSSNPPLSENELLNLLILGRDDTTPSGKQSESIPGASEATSFITGQTQQVIEERVRQITGLDVMTVEPGFSKATGSMTPRVTIGKKLMDGRLNVTYSAGTAETTEQIIKVEYLMTRGISLVGTRDEIGGISGAVKFRFEFR